MELIAAPLLLLRDEDLLHGGLLSGDCLGEWVIYRSFAFLG